MFKLRTPPAVAALVAIALASAARAQLVPPGSQLFLLHEEIARPSMLPQYEATSKEFVSLVREHHAKMPHFSILAFQGDDFSFVYLTPIANLAALDSISNEFGALATAAGPRLEDIFRRGGETMEHWNDLVLVEDPALSYRPANPRVIQETAPYRHLDFYFLKPGFEPTADALAREFKALYTRLGLNTEYHVYKILLGPEAPALLVSIAAKDAADFAVQDAKDRALAGTDGVALFSRAFSGVRRFDSKGYWARPDLSAPASP